MKRLFTFLTSLIFMTSLVFGQSAVDLTSPANSLSGVSVKPEFEWFDNDGADSYTFGNCYFFRFQQ
ncbi:MAG: hypothetical protein U5K00_00600 [Melioribacteraceae bacterium]|nr:hypothetical protein [Melioribacteraceae bacterium]